MEMKQGLRSEVNSAVPVGRGEQGSREKLKGEKKRSEIGYLEEGEMGGTCSERVGMGAGEQFPKEWKEHLREEMEILGHLDPMSMIFRPQKIRVGKIPRQLRGRKTLVLNLESFIQIDTSENSIHSLSFTEEYQIPFYIRQHTPKFLKEMRRFFDILFFTSLEKDIAMDLVRGIWIGFENKNMIGREGCSLLGDFTIKELSTIKNRYQGNMLVLDHLMATWYFDQDSYVPLSPFIPTLSPNQEIGLLQVISVLKELATTNKYFSPKYIAYCKLLTS